MNQGENAMLSPKHQRYADRLRELVEEGQEVAKLERPTTDGYPAYIQGEDIIKVQTWLVKTRNVIHTVFGEDSPHASHFVEVLPAGGTRNVSQSHEVFPIVGVLEGALKDLEDGFLMGQEFLIAAEVFDTILEQARELNDKGYKDPAAVLCRVALEDALKRMARAEGINDNQKAAAINTDLRKAKVYNKPKWRQIQAWLDTGNEAAHGNFQAYDEQDVESLIEGIEQFLATDFAA